MAPAGGRSSKLGGYSCVPTLPQHFCVEVYIYIYT